MKGKATSSVQDASVKARLLEAALDCFNRKGYAAATVREIVEAAGVTKPVLYYYFGSKEGLYRELMESAFAQFDALLKEAGRKEGPARARLEALFEEALRLFRRHAAVARLMYAIYYGPPQGAPPFDFDRYHFAFQDLVRSLLLEGRRGGEFRFSKPEDALWALIGAVNIAMEMDLCHPEMALDSKDLRRVLGVVFAGLAPAPGAARKKGATS